MPSISCGEPISRRRWRSSPRSKATTAAPSRTSVIAVHAPMQPSAPVTSHRSSDIVVDGDDLRVELHRRAALLVRAEAGALDPTEGDVDVRAGRLRVDVQDARLELVDEALR